MTIQISIHVLRVEDDQQPTPIIWVQGEISIHVLRVEDDAAILIFSAYFDYFNPRPPCGGRHAKQKPGH